MKKLKVKNEPKLHECDDWKTLKKGDRIKTLSGSGPVYISGDQTEYMGHYGVFTVDSIDKDGIRVFGDEGFAYIFMGKERKAITGTILRPHKIKLLRKDS